LRQEDDEHVSHLLQFMLRRKSTRLTSPAMGARQYSFSRTTSPRPSQQLQTDFLQDKLA
jgi:hypothetical protein